MIPLGRLLRLSRVEAQLMKIMNIIGASACFAAAVFGQSASYTVTDLGPATSPFSQSAFVNNNGFVAGNATAMDGTSHSLLWYEGISGDIGGLGGPNSGAGGVNESGVAIGSGDTTSKDPNDENVCGYGTGLQCLVYEWQNGTIEALPTLGGTNANWGNINNRGEVTGFAETNARDKTCPTTPAPNGTGPQVLDYLPVIWGPGKGEIRTLGLPPGDTVGVAFFINDNEQVVGMAGTCANTVIPPIAASAHAVLWENGAVTDLGNLGGTANPAAQAEGVGNAAFAINNSGQVVGVSALPGNQKFHAFLWTWETGMKDLGTLPGDLVSAGLGINDRGEVIGNSVAPPGLPMGQPHPWLWRDGVMVNLNMLIPSDSPLQLLTASWINNRGQITGFGITSDGNIHAYLLTPVAAASASEAGTTATTAIVTPTNLVTLEPSVVLDGSESTSAAGSLQYLYEVVPGGKQATLLQTPSNPKATVQFVNGPGLYLVQLTVTDGKGTSAKSPVVMLNYQSSTTAGS